MSRIYVAGYTGSVTPSVLWIDPDTLAMTALPVIPVSKRLQSIAVISEDEIVVGHGDTANNSDVQFSHWNGSTWTTYTYNYGGGGSSGWNVIDLHVVSSTEIYALIYTSSFGNSHVLRWNGTAWSTFATVSPFTLSGGSSIWPGSTATDMWVSNIGFASGKHIAHWNGSAWDLIETVGTLFVNVSGLVTYKGQLYCGSYNGNAYVRTGPDAWSSVFSIPLAQGAFAPRFGNAWWHDTELDLLWAGYSYLDGSTKWGVLSWDGTTRTLYPNTAWPTAAPWWNVRGLMTFGAPAAAIYYTSPAGLEKRGTDGTWVHTGYAVGSAYQGIDVLQDPLYTAPYLQDQSPAPGSTHNKPDVPVSLSVRDAESDLVLSTVRIYVNDTLAWKGGAILGGFDGDIDPVEGDDGYSFGATPAAPFEPGLQSVRVVAEDAGALQLDETYTFATVAPILESDEQEAEDRTAGVDLKLDVTTHDLVITDHDLELVAGADEVAQHLRVGLRLFRGEWYLDDEAGVPYYRHVLINAPSSRVIEALFRQEILGDVDIEALTEFTLTADTATRQLYVTFRAVSRLGPVDVRAVFP